MDLLIQVVGEVNAFVWGPVMIVILMGTHFFMTVRTGFIQRKLVTAIKLSVTKDPDAAGDISQFAALATALASTIGTGNIVGVATALLAGGPGAIFWLWLTGGFGMATKYAESYIGVKYRVKDSKGNMLGGAMYALERAFPHRWWSKLLAVLFAAFAVLASFGIGSAVQANSLTGIVVSTLPMIPSWAVGLAVVILVSVVIFGGVQVIARVCEKFVPFMAIAYSLGCIIILVMNWQHIIPAIVLIVECAFTPKAAFGGAVGSGLLLALQKGTARGLFSNESGMGSAPIVASAATTRNPARQALVSMTGTFWDTVVMCLITGLVLVTTMIANPQIQETILANPGFAAADLTTLAFGSIPILGPAILVFGMVTFAYSTILGWSYYGNRCVTYLFGRKAIFPYQVVYVAFAFIGSIGVGTVVWNISDITNALMVIPNIIVVLLLSALIARETKHYVYDNHLDEKDETPIPTVEGK